jgi:UDP-glucose 4-epimerase
MRILVTGGAGYIGTHAVVELLDAGHDVAVVDNLSNSKAGALRRVHNITGREFVFHEADIRDARALSGIFGEGNFDAVIHFAGLKAVGESTEKPREYYSNNVGGTLTLLETMEAHGVRDLVFSSSATVYGAPDAVPIPETAPIRATNPYGQSKVMIEQILTDVSASDPRWSICLLRYFNPVGAHASGRIGEDPNGVPLNLLPYMTQVAVGRLSRLEVFGGDYDTPDGTGVRDYIHVVDLAQGHLAALNAHAGDGGLHVYNLGTGRGTSVLALVAAFERVTGQAIPREIVARRPGDVAECYADVQRAETALGWTAKLDLDAMVCDAWRWQSDNPGGYPD